MEAITHIVIVWSTAISYKDEIVRDIKQKFELLKVVKVHWTPSLFYDNLKVFYSHSLRDMNEELMKRVIRGKIKSVGKNDFYVIVFKDNSPTIGKRKTTSGECIVNTSVFDLKEYYRKITGDSNIHSSNDSWETNKDLTILFRQNTEDFVKNSLVGNNYNNDCLGVKGFDSLEQFFYLLNNTIDYCVLRNFEGIPEKYTLEGHDDIDLLVSHRHYALRLTGAKPKFAQEYRVFNYIYINNKKVAFDFRYIGDDYYDNNWEQEILSTRILNKNLFYIPNDTNSYYSLLYHAFIQKRKIKDDYKPKLEKYAQRIGSVFYPDVFSSLQQIDNFLKKHHYCFSKPKDKSVVFNQSYVNVLEGWQFFTQKKEFKNIIPYKLDQITGSGYVYFIGSLCERKVFIKYGGIGETCKNEYYYSKKAYLRCNKHFVEPISFGDNNKTNYIVYEFVEGQSLMSYCTSISKNEKDNLGKQIIDIYNTLCDECIMHRDIRPTNFIVKDGTVKLLDFQYAIDIKEKKELDCLRLDIKKALFLGEDYRYKRNAWKDTFSIEKLLLTLNIDYDKKTLQEEPAIYIPFLRYYTYLIHRRINEIKKSFNIVR